MDLAKLRRGELIAAAGGLLLLIALFFLDWYSAGTSVTLPLGTTVSVSGDFGAWDGEGFFGFIANLVILAAAVSAVGLAVLTATSRTIALPVAASAITATLGIGAVVMVLLRMLFQPGPNELISLKFGILLALIAAVIVAYGGWISMREEGTTFEAARDQLQSRYVRRPVPERRPQAEPRTAPEPETAPEPGRPPASEPEPFASEREPFASEPEPPALEPAPPPAWEPPPDFEDEPESRPPPPA
jgi:hypothetical protein